MGKYIKVWLYDSNEKYLDSIENVGLTVNNAISLYANSTQTTQVQTTLTGTAATPAPMYVLSAAPATSGATAITTSMANVKTFTLTCPKGHLLINGDKCISNACKYSKTVL